MKPLAKAAERAYCREMTGYPAPDLDVSEWIGEPRPLASLRGKVVLLEAFQMLCPACITHSLPQAKKVQETFRGVVVVGLHTVFEHHEVMGPDALRTFLSEFRYTFSVGVDRHVGGVLPVTMQRYGFRGTPSTVLIDKAGVVRLSHFGAIDDLALGGHLGLLLGEPAPEEQTDDGPEGQAP